MIRENTFYKNESHRAYIFTSGYAHCKEVYKIIILCWLLLLGGNGLSKRTIKHYYTKKLCGKMMPPHLSKSELCLYVALLNLTCLMKRPVPETAC